MQGGRNADQPESPLEQQLASIDARLASIERALAYMIDALAGDEDEGPATDLDGNPVGRERQWLDTL